MTAHLRVQAITVHPTGDDTPPFLLVRITLACDVCGPQEFVLAGHHLKPLLELLTSVADEVDPALIDDPGEGTASPAPPNRRVH